ncbi:class I SAM-dependent methyltransferase [Sphaerotilaceae bacterium SBD11-9]
MSMDPSPKAEALAVVERYGRRKSGSLYSILRPEVIHSTQDWQRQMLLLFGSVCGYSDVTLRELKLVDVGCGYGGHLLDFLRFGFAPQNLFGIELLPDRVAGARQRLPASLAIHEGDASTVGLQPQSQDVVFQSVVFSSLLDDTFQQELADRMWSWVRPGGGILWYDFIYNNPSNRDVRAVPVKRIKALFPDGRLTVRRVTLAPPIARTVVRLHPSLYTLFNVLPPLRTHVLCWIAKP